MKCLECGVENEDSAKFCSSCGVDLNLEKKSFWKHLFNWKYYIFPLLLGIFVGAGTYAFQTLGLSNEDNKVPMLIWIGVLIQTVKFKAPLRKKILMFFASFLSLIFVMGITSGITVLVYTAINTSWTEQSNTKKEYIQRLLAANSKLPVMLNEGLQILKYTSIDSSSIKMHCKFTQYTKDEILSDYNNSNDFEEDMLDTELKTSCNSKSLKKMSAIGIVTKVVYYGKNNNLIGQIYLDDERCQPYYDNTDLN